MASSVLKIKADELNTNSCLVDIFQLAKERLPSAASYAGDITALEAWQILTEDQHGLLVDVRTKAECCFVGIPDLTAINKKPLFIEWQIYPSMQPNSQFLIELSKNQISSDTPLLFLCRSGSRSMSAAQLCASNGFISCFNIIDGFEGPLDANKQRTSSFGWKMQKLSWIQS